MQPSSRFRFPIPELPSTYLTRLPRELTREISEYLAHCPSGSIRLSPYPYQRRAIMDIRFGPSLYSVQVDLDYLKKSIQDRSSKRVDEIFQAISRGEQEYYSMRLTRDLEVGPAMVGVADPIEVKIRFDVERETIPSFYMPACVELFEALSQLEQWALNS